MLIGGWDDPNGPSVLVSTDCDEAQHRACQRAGRHPEGNRRCQCHCHLTSSERTWLES